MKVSDMINPLGELTPGEQDEIRNIVDCVRSEYNLHGAERAARLWDSECEHLTNEVKAAGWKLFPSDERGRMAKITPEPRLPPAPVPAKVQTAVAEYSPTVAGLADLTARYKGLVFDVTTVKGMDAAKRGRAEIRTLRVNLEAKRVEIKAPALEHCRLIDAEAKRLEAELKAIELPIDEQIKAQEARREAARLAKEEAERLAKEEAEREAEAARQAVIAAERAELERQRAELAEAQKKQAEAEQAARMRIEAAEREARLKIETAERAMREQAEAEAARIKAERDKFEAEQRAIEDARRKARQEAEDKARAEQARIEAVARAEREAKELAARQARELEEARQREIERQQNELLDARAMLTTFKARFGHRKEFAGVILAIDAMRVRKVAERAAIER